MLHIELAQIFEFPAYYGGNWDAFDEAFHDEHPLPAVTELRWLSAETLAAKT